MASPSFGHSKQRTRSPLYPPALLQAPVITIFDHRGCNRGGANREYTGAMAKTQDDEMLVKVESRPIVANQDFAARFLAETISFKSKGIDGDYTGSA